MIIDDYLESQAKLTEKFGDCIVLYAVGSFYEIYSLSEEFIQRIGDLLNIIVTRKNKSNPIVDRGNHYLCGFPTVSLPRFLNVLLQNNLTVAIYVQEKTGNEVTRSLTATYSPTTVMEENGAGQSSFDANILMTIAFQKDKDWRTGRETVALGAVAVDLSTGKSWAYQTLAATDRLCASQDALRLLKTFQPREILLITGEEDARTDPKHGDIEETLEIKGRMIHRIETFPSAITKVGYQNHVLSASFPETQMLTPIEFVNLENKPLASTCLVHTLLFIKDHDEGILKKMCVPVVMNDVAHMLLENNAIQQLNVLPSPGSAKSATGSLFDIVQFCCTNFGRRELKSRLIMPLLEKDAIEERQGEIERMLEDRKFEAVQEHLKGIIDIERLHRKLSLNKISPYEVHQLLNSYKKCTSLFDCLSSLRIETDITSLKERTTALANVISDTFDLEEIQKFSLHAMNNLEVSFLRREVSSEADHYSDLIAKELRALEDLRAALNAILDKNEKIVRLEYSDKDGHYYFVLTKKRAETLKRALPARVTFSGVTMEREEFCFEYSKSQVAKITSNRMRESSDSIMLHKEKLSRACRNKFNEFVEEFSRNLPVFEALVEKLTSIDVAAGGALCAFKYGYTKPTIEAGDETSFVEVESLRHPIIERLQTGIDYVPNDVCLGKGGMDGMLLYGINSSGKSSLMKALGLAVILAQAGLYVPARRMRICPFEKLMTRILSHDNLWKQQSSFTYEMQEVKGIVSGANRRTLVLGDELANSTETTSGIAIVATSIMRLSTLNAKFLLSSHLHELADMSQVTTLSNVGCYHLECRYDANTDTLMYDRMLKPGSGNARYGIEVCAASGFDAEFIKVANQIRQEIIEGPATCKKSRYNARLMVRECSVCGRKDKLETHHIVQQKYADAQGMLQDGKQKNELSNLCVLCETCHDKLHNEDGIKISGWKMTNKGKRLQSDDGPFEQFRFKGNS